MWGTMNFHGFRQDLSSSAGIVTAISHSLSFGHIEEVYKATHFLSGWELWPPESVQHWCDDLFVGVHPHHKACSSAFYLINHQIVRVCLGMPYGRSIRHGGSHKSGVVVALLMYLVAKQLSWTLYSSHLQLAVFCEGFFVIVTTRKTASGTSSSR